MLLQRASTLEQQNHCKQLSIPQVDTFEAVKNNVYDMLGDLAQDLNNQQLDALFNKFEGCTGRQDAMKIMDLMRRLAKSDTKVRILCLNPRTALLWVVGEPGLQALLHCPVFRRLWLLGRMLGI